MRILLPIFLCWLPIAAGTSMHDAGLFVFRYGSTSRHQVDDCLNVGDVRKFIDSRLRDQSTVLGQVDEKLVQGLDYLNGGHSRVLGGTETQLADDLLVVWEGVSLDNPFYAMTTIPAPRAVTAFKPVAAMKFTYKSTLKYETRRKEPSSTSANRLANIPANLLLPNIKVFQGLGLQPDVETVNAVFDTLRDLATSSKRQILLVFSPSTLFDRSPSKKQGRRFEPAEQRLSDIVSNPNDGESVSALPKSTPKQDTRVPSRIIPVCFASNETCSEHTHNCSGHGYCYRKSSSKNNVASKDCFACKCVTTVVSRHPDGRPKKTIQWGGPACQKRDISTPFFIFVTLTVLIALAIIGGIRLLYTMGQEELPSVLSAGVAAKVQK
ncbi:hypothetical protein KEM54_002403 [Ascosphaera aggregata]|nr:hypothetical protein KEM54_002403 [Ascosphaera aggregata]